MAENYSGAILAYALIGAVTVTCAERERTHTGLPSKPAASLPIGARDCNARCIRNTLNPFQEQHAIHENDAVFPWKGFRHNMTYSTGKSLRQLKFNSFS
jgi:hypothetical protein